MTEAQTLDRWDPLSPKGTFSSLYVWTQHPATKYITHAELKHIAWVYSATQVGFSQAHHDLWWRWVTKCLHQISLSFLIPQNSRARWRECLKAHRTSSHLGFLPHLIQNSLAAQASLFYLCQIRQKEVSPCSFLVSVLVRLKNKSSPLPGEPKKLWMTSVWGHGGTSSCQSDSWKPWSFKPQCFLLGGPALFYGAPGSFCSEGYNRIVWTERQQHLSIVAHAFLRLPVPLRVGDAKSRLAGRTCCSKLPARGWVYLRYYSQF